MLASIGRKSANDWSFVHSPIAFGPSLKRTAAAIGWGVAIGAGTMLFEVVAVVGALYVSGIVAF
jgi:hypothetical protein